MIKFISRLTRLKYFWMCSCGYACDETSHNLTSLPQPADDPENMFALGALQRHANQVRKLAGYKPFSEHDYPYAKIGSQSKAVG